MSEVVSYAEIPAVNWSSLKHMAVSPMLYRYRLTHPEEQKAAYVLGAAVHCAILEPDCFEERFAVYDGPREGEGSRKARKAWREAHAGVAELEPDEMMAVNTMATAVLSHRVAAGLLRGGRREEVVTWTDPITGIACKGRLDYLRPDVVIDLKMTRDLAKFNRAAADYEYPAQVAYYHDGATVARLIPGDQRPWIIAVQSLAPDLADVACYQLDVEALADGRSTYRRLLRRLDECIRADYWPGAAPDPLPLTLPPWKVAKTIAQEEGDQEDF